MPIPPTLRLLIALTVPLVAVSAADPTTVTITGDPNPVAYGQTVTVTAAVSASSGTPTGIIRFQEGTLTLDMQLVDASGRAQSTPKLQAGTHVITATYGGDTNFAASTSSPFTITINRVSTVLNVSASPNPSTYGQNITFNSTIAGVPNYAGPSGTLTINDGNNAMMSQTGPVSFVTLTTSSLSPGTHTINFVYTGDTDFNSATASVTQVVNPAPLKSTVTSLISSANPAPFGQLLTLTATVTAASGGGTPSGTVTFNDGGASLGTATLDGSGRATRTVASLTVGSHSLSVVYGGDYSFSSSTSNTLPQVIVPATPLPTTTNVTSSPNPSALGQTVTFTATVSAASAGGLAPGGTVLFRDSGTVLFTAMLNSSRQASFTSATLGAGSHSIAADYGGDNNFAASTGILAHVVNKAATSTAVNVQPASPVAGAQATLTATVTSPAGTPTGNVNFLDGTTVLGASRLSSAGQASLSFSPSPGARNFSASYAGDSSFLSSVSPPLSVTVRGSVTVTLTASPASPTPGQPVTLTAAVWSTNAGALAPSGTVTFADSSSRLGAATLDATGHAVLTLAVGLSTGDHSLVASYGGDPNFLAVSSATLLLHVSQTPTVTVLSEAVGPGGPVLTAVITAASGVPSGAVRFDDLTAGRTLGSATLSGDRATLALTETARAGDVLQASYAGDGTFPPSTSAPLPLLGAVNGFSFAYAAFAPDEISAIFGAGMTNTADAAPPPPLPSTLAGVTLSVLGSDGGSYPASLYYASPAQINFIIPGHVPPGPAKLMLNSPVAVLTVGIAVSSIAPALAVAPPNGAAAGQVLRVHADGPQDPADTITDAPIAFGAATDQLYLILYGTGFRHAQSATVCSVGGASVSAAYSGAQPVYPGMDQINLRLPDTLRGAGPVSLTCTADGQVSNAAKLNLQ